MGCEWCEAGHPHAAGYMTDDGVWEKLWHLHWDATGALQACARPDLGPVWERLEGRPMRPATVRPPARDTGGSAPTS